MDSKEFQELLRKYRAGKTTEEEVRLIDEWYKAYGNERPEWTSQQKKAIRNGIHTKILRAIDPSPVMMEEKVTPVVRRWPNQFVRFGKVAAILVCLLSAFYFTHRQYAADPHAISDRDLEEMIVETDRGQVKQLTLPDSTVVWLNSGSKVRFAKNFSKSGERKIFIEFGEAHFVVTRDTLKPFIVQSDLTITRVLGTSFTVKAYKDLSYEQVAVSSGKVQVSLHHGEKTELLGARDFIKINRQNQMIELGEMEPAQNSSWREGVTYLEQASFEELALVIQNLYGMTLTAQSHIIESQRYTLIIDRKVPLNDLIEAVCAVNNNDHKKEGGKVIIF